MYVYHNKRAYTIFNRTKSHYFIRVKQTHALIFFPNVNACDALFSMQHMYEKIDREKADPPVVRTTYYVMKIF